MNKPYVFHSLSVCAGCGCSGDDFGSVNVEAFEATGELYCEECAEGAIAHDDPEDDGDCPNCAGEGVVSHCFEEYACVDPDEGCDLCLRPCDWCKPRRPKAAA